MSRAERRHQINKRKKVWVKRLKGWGLEATPKQVGYRAATGQVCSSCCGNPRRHGKNDALTIQERIAIALEKITEKEKSK